MRLHEIYKAQKGDTLSISFEFFPPKDEKDISTVFLDNVSKLLEFNPVLISITSSACGNKDINSKEVLKFLAKNTNVTIMPHLTCKCASKDNVHEKLDFIKSLNFENILALRGDEPKNIDICYNDFCYANELISYIKENTDLSIAAAGYPEGHIDAASLDEDILNLKRKIDCGAQIIFTQLFFENEKFYRYIEKLDEVGIKIPVIAGIMPIISYKQIERMTSLANITIPNDLAKQVEKFKDNPLDIKKLGIDFGIEQCKNLVMNGFKNLHFYTLNQYNATSKIIKYI